MELAVGTPDRLADEFARLVAARSREALASMGRFSIAIPGGSVAKAFLPALGKTPMQWQDVDLFLADERVVPESDPESNAGLARRLLADTAASGARWHTHDFQRLAFDGQLAAEQYSSELVSVAGSPPVLDVVLLGTGEDGHVASVFPGDDDVQSSVHFVDQSPKPPAKRVTLTLQTICRARLVVVAAFGDAKAEVVRDAVTGTRKDLPVATVLHRVRDAWLMVDQAAASLLPPSR